MIQAVSNSESSGSERVEMPSGSEEYSDNGSSKTRGKIIGKMRDNFRQAKNKGIYLRKVLFQAAYIKILC